VFVSEQFLDDAVAGIGRKLFGTTKNRKMEISAAVCRT
jgi:hypothetical protein